MNDEDMKILDGTRDKIRAKNPEAWDSAAQASEELTPVIAPFISIHTAAKMKLGKKIGDELFSSGISAMILTYCENLDDCYSFLELLKKDIKKMEDVFNDAFSEIQPGKDTEKKNDEANPKRNKPNGRSPAKANTPGRANNDERGN